jgi:hypothetical protein
MTEKTSPVKRSPVPALTGRAHIGHKPLFALDFRWSDEFQSAFFALIEVYHSKKKNSSQLKNIFDTNDLRKIQTNQRKSPFK